MKNRLRGIIRRVLTYSVITTLTSALSLFVMTACYSSHAVLILPGLWMVSSASWFMNFAKNEEWIHAKGKYLLSSIKCCTSKSEDKLDKIDLQFKEEDTDSTESLEYNGCHHDDNDSVALSHHRRQTTELFDIAPLNNDHSCEMDVFVIGNGMHSTAPTIEAMEGIDECAEVAVIPRFDDAHYKKNENTMESKQRVRSLSTFHANDLGFAPSLYPHKRSLSAISGLQSVDKMDNAASSLLNMMMSQGFVYAKVIEM